MPVDNWHELIGDPTLADAILDRLVHYAYRINLKGLCLEYCSVLFEQDSAECLASIRRKPYSSFQIVVNAFVALENAGEGLVQISFLNRYQGGG